MSEIVTGAAAKPSFVDDSHTAPEAESFTWDHFFITDQADWVDIYNLGPFSYDSAVPAAPEWFIVFSRRVVIEAPAGFKCGDSGKIWGCEVVAYKCDANGVVTDWGKRYEFQASCRTTAAQKLRFLLINNLVWFSDAPQL
jgi:hypothetical protein